MKKSRLFRFVAGLRPRCSLRSPVNRQSPAQSRLSLLAFVTLGSLPLLTACQVLTYRSSTGERFTRGSLGANVAISSLVVESATNGIRKVELRGYQNDSTQALGTVTEAAVRAAINSGK